MIRGHQSGLKELNIKKSRNDYEGKHLINSFAPWVHLEAGQKVSGPKARSGLIQFGVFPVGVGGVKPLPHRCLFDVPRILHVHYRSDPIAHLAESAVNASGLARLFL